MTEKAKAAPTKAAKSTTEANKVEDSEAKIAVEAETADEGFKAKPKSKSKSSSKAATEDIEIEELLDGVVGVFGEGLGKVVDSSTTIGTGLFSDAQSVARSVVSTVIGSVIKGCQVVENVAGVKDRGFHDKGRCN